MARGGRAGKKRTQYVRDNSGRFASTPGGGPSKATPASVRKAVKAAAIKGGTLQFRTSLRRSKAKLAAIDRADETLKTTLSRRAQKGAVTRGQKAARAAIKSSRSKLGVAPKMGVIKKKRKAPQPALQSVKNETPKEVGQKIRPGEFVRANLRPRNVMAKPQISDKSWGKTKKENLAKAEALAKSEGYSVYVNKKRDAKGIASFNLFRPNYITLVKNSEYWSKPKKHSIEGRRSGWFASSDPKAVVMHEIGHSKTKRSGFINDPSQPWGIGSRPFDSPRNKQLAKRVSGYATTSPSEFAAETYAGRRTGRKYDYQVMQAYRQEKGLNPNPIVRKLKKKGKTKST
jgi:hypothetical protein